MKYLFWNTHKNEKINSVLCDLIIENGISIVVLAEYAADMNELIQLLDIRGVSMQQYPTIGCDRIHIVGEVGIHVEPQLHADHWTIQEIPIVKGTTQQLTLTQLVHKTKRRTSI